MVQRQSRTSSHPPRRRRGSGTQRERRPGIWEVRVPAPPDPVSGRTRQASVTVHGTRAEADAARVQLLTTAPAATGKGLSLAGLLEAWEVAEHPWKPSTRASHRSVARALAADPIGLEVAAGLRPALVRAAMSRWAGNGAPCP